jgi:hypothetical protein
MEEHSQCTEIEQGVRDDQSGGFDMEHAHLLQPAELDVCCWLLLLLHFGVMN